MNGPLKASNTRNAIVGKYMSIGELCNLSDQNEARAEAFGFEVKKSLCRGGIIGKILRDGRVIEQKKYVMKYAVVREAHMHCDFMEYLNAHEHRINELARQKLDSFICSVREIVFNGMKSEEDARREHLSKDKERKAYSQFCRYAIESEISIEDVAQAVVKVSPVPAFDSLGASVEKYLKEHAEAMS